MVVASFEPLAELARAVAGDGARVVNLTPAGAEPHDLELSTDDVDALEDADLVLYLGEGFQPAIEKVARRLDHAVDLLDDLPLTSAARTGEDAADPHVWLDPVLMARMVEVVSDALVEAAPDRAASLRANAAAFTAELDELDADYASSLARCARRLLVTAHASFHYLANRYDLEQASISGLSPEAEPDPNRIAELVELIEDTGTTTVFYEELVSPVVARALAREAGVTARVLDPIEGLTADDRAAGRGYVQVMRRNLAVLVEALACQAG